MHDYGNRTGVDHCWPSDSTHLWSVKIGSGRSRRSAQHDQNAVPY